MLLVKIAALPLGFSKLALNKHLSLQSIDLILQYLEWLQVDIFAKPSPTADGIFAASQPIATKLERLVVATLRAYCNYLDRHIKRSPYLMSEMLVQAQVNRFPSVDGANEDEKDAIAWACGVLSCVTDHKTDSQRWARKGLLFLQMEDSRKGELGELFFPLLKSDASF